MYKLVTNSYPIYVYKKATRKPNGNIFFIHGYAVNSDYHNYFSDSIDDYNYYAIEHPGHGITPLHDKSQLSPLSFAQNVVKLIEELDLKDIILIGHSMGGGIATIVSQMIPQRIKKMVLVTPMNSKGTTKIFNFLFKMNPKKRKNIRSYYKILLGDINKLDDIPSIEIDKLLQNQKQFSKNYKILKRRIASLKNLLILARNEKNLKVDTLIIVGDKDDCINANSTIKNFNRKNPRNKLLSYHIMKNCGHLPFVEFTDKYCKIIRQFISN